MRAVEQLYQLQELDEGIALYESRLREWGSRLQRVHDTLADVRRLCQAAGEAVRAQESRARQTEGKLFAQEGRLKELEKRLYSDTIRSEREAQAIQAEIEQVRQQKDALESEALQLMLETDERRAYEEDMRQEEERALQEYENLSAEMAAHEALLKGQIEPLRTARDSLLTQIDDRALALYRLVQRARGQAVARIVENACSGCRLEVPLLVRKAATGEDLVRCPNCGRLLLV